MADEQSVLKMFERCDAELGPLSCLVNNAGVLFPVTRVEDLTVDRLRRGFRRKPWSAPLSALERRSGEWQRLTADRAARS